MSKYIPDWTSSLLFIPFNEPINDSKHYLKSILSDMVVDVLCVSYLESDAMLFFLVVVSGYNLFFTLYDFVSLAMSCLVLMPFSLKIFLVSSIFSLNISLTLVFLSLTSEVSILIFISSASILA